MSSGLSPQTALFVYCVVDIWFYLFPFFSFTEGLCSVRAEVQLAFLKHTHTQSKKYSRRCWKTIYEKSWRLILLNARFPPEQTHHSVPWPGENIAVVTGSLTHRRTHAECQLCPGSSFKMITYHCCLPEVLKLLWMLELVKAVKSPQSHSLPVHRHVAGAGSRLQKDRFERHELLCNYDYQHQILRQLYHSTEEDGVEMLPFITFFFSAFR